jgi:hypothetical protein
VSQVSGSPKLGDDLVALMCGGVAVLAATRSDDLRPEVVRAWGPAVTADGSVLTLCVPAPPGSRTRSNLEANGETAVLFVSPTSYRALQVKGTAVECSETRPDQLELIEEHVLAFAANTRALGVELSQMRRLVEPIRLSPVCMVAATYTHSFVQVAATTPLVAPAGRGQAPAPSRPGR